MLFANATQIAEEHAREMLDAWFEDSSNTTQGQFWYYCEDGDDHRYVVIDNMSHDFLMEEFKNPEAAHAWLRGIDVDVCYEIDKTLREFEEAEALAYAEYERKREIELLY